jgi:hypothetical protein
MAEDDATDPAVSDDPVYAYKPSLMGAPWGFRLGSDALEWQVGSHQGRTPYRRIIRVRLSYRPATMQSRRFLTEVWSAEGPRLSIVSSSWRSVIELAAQDQAYGAFVRELHRRLAAADTKASFDAGSPAILYWPGLAIVGSATVAVGAMSLHALWLKNWPAAAIVGGFFGLFAWQGGAFFWRNRPRRYRPDAVPSDLVPRA